MVYNVKKFEHIDSTSIWARKHLDELNDFDIISADIQSQGHGQFERKWYSSSANGGNIYISIILKPDKIDHLNELTRFTSFIAAKTVESYGVNPKFKYPNDILINGKKIAGILAESVFVGSQFKGVITGIGINLNLKDEDIKHIDIPATSLFIETNKHINKEEFLEKLLDNFKEEYSDFLKCGLKKELTYSN